MKTITLIPHGQSSWKNSDRPINRRRRYNSAIANLEKILIYGIVVLQLNISRGSG